MDRTNPVITPFTPLHTSSSLSYLASPSLPTTPSLLSRHQSRSSISDLAPSKSHPNIPSASNASNPPTNPQRKRRLPTKKPSDRTPAPSPGPDNDWLTRTASALTLNRLEEKGQSWLIARESGTATDHVAFDEHDIGDEGILRARLSYSSTEMGRSRYTSARSSFTRLGGGRSRRGSAVGRGLGALSERAEGGKEGAGGREEGEGFQGPDFVDARDVAEALGLDGNVEEESEEDEREMDRMVLGRVGGWVDWAVGWIDVRGEGGVDSDEEDGVEHDDGTDEAGARGPRGQLDALDVEEIRRRLDRQAEADAKDEEEAVEIGPPPGEGGWVGDAKWLFGVAKRIAL